MTDFDLLRGYTTSGCEEDFSVLVGRYANLVYSAALRQTGVAHDAEEISQIVFIILARKAGTIREGTVLSGWLIRTTRFVAQNARRREARRRRTEIDALNAYLNETDSAWKQIAPLLDEALVSLSDKDRDAVLLRFFERKSFRDIGHVLGTSEDTAQKRVSRALGRLRDICLKRGVVLPSTMFGVAITANAVQAAPSYLAASTISAVTAGAAVAESISTGVKATLAALERDRIRTLGLRTVKAGLVILVALLTSYLFWPTTASLSPNGLGAARPEQPPPSQASPPQDGGAPIFAQANFRQLRLRVLDFQSETPISNARVTSKWGIMPYPRRNEAVTDSQGECEVAFNLAPREYWAVVIQIIKDGYIPKFVNWAEPRGDLLDMLPTEYTTKLTRGQTVGGVVLSDNGDPVPDARVNLDGPGPSFNGDGSPEREGLAIAHTEVTDAQGRWLCNHVPPQMERIHFNVLHPLYVSASFGVAKSQDTSFSPIIPLSEQDLQAQTAVMIVKRGLVVRGAVVDEEGKAIAGARVTKDRGWSDPSANETTGTDGRFRFANVAKEELILTVQADGFVAQDKTSHLRTDTIEPHFELSHAAVLHGMVVEESGKPIPKATVVASGGDFSIERFEWHTLTDELGKFAWHSVPPLHKRYDIYVDGFASPTNLELFANGVEQRITLRGSAKTPRFRISGNVVDAETRQPINAFEVWEALKIRYDINNSVVSFSPELRTTGTRGEFAFMTSRRIVGLAESYEVEIRAQGYSPAKLVVPGQLTNAFQLDFALKSTASVTGVVQSPHGQPVGGAVVLVCDKSEDLAYMKSPGELDLAVSRGNRAQTDTNGTFMIPLATGSGTVFIAHSSGYAIMPAAQLLASRTQTLQPWGGVAGLLMVGSQPGTNETVYLGNVSPRNPTLPQVHLTATTDVDGRFTLDGVPPGEWRFSHELRRRGRQTGRIPLTQTFTIQVRSGQVTQVMLGGAGRRVVGRLTTNEAGQRRELEGCLLTLTTELPGLTFPRREQFASETEYGAARVIWLAQKLAFQNSPASREYLTFVESDGSFGINDVVPGNYELKVEIESVGFGEHSSIRPDPVVMNWLDGLNREVVVSEASGDEAAPVDLGILEPNLQKP